MGRGRIEGRPVVVGGDDFTVRGGADDGAIGNKMVAEQMARDLRLPMVRLVDGTGGGGSVKTNEMPATPMCRESRTGSCRRPSRDGAGRRAGPGPVAGLGAARVAAAHFSVMVKGTSQIFVAGPPVVDAARREVDKEELGGADIHAPQRRRRQRGRQRGRGVRACPPLPLLPAVDGRDAGDAGRANDDPERREEVAARGGASRPAQGPPTCAASSRWCVDWARCSRSGGWAAARVRRWRGSTAFRSVLANDPRQRGGWSRRRGAEDDPLRRPLRHLPSAGRALRRQPGLRDRRRAEKAARSATACARSRRSTRRACRGARSSCASVRRRRRGSRPHQR